MWKAFERLCKMQNARYGSLAPSLLMVSETERIGDNIIIAQLEHGHVLDGSVMSGKDDSIGFVSTRYNPIWWKDYAFCMVWSLRSHHHYVGICISPTVTSPRLKCLVFPDHVPLNTFQDHKNAQTLKYYTCLAGERIVSVLNPPANQPSLTLCHFYRSLHLSFNGINKIPIDIENKKFGQECYVNAENVDENSPKFLVLLPFIRSSNERTYLLVEARGRDDPTIQDSDKYADHIVNEKYYVETDDGTWALTHRNKEMEATLLQHAQNANIPLRVRTFEEGGNIDRYDVGFCDLSISSDTWFTPIVLVAKSIQWKTPMRVPRQSHLRKARTPARNLVL